MTDGSEGQRRAAEIIKAELAGTIIDTAIEQIEGNNMCIYICIYIYIYTYI